MRTVPALLILACVSFGAGAAGQTTAPLTTRLHDRNPLERAKAACEARNLGDGARPILSDLAAMLSDDAEVPPDACDDRGPWSNISEATPTTPGEKAAAALVAIGTAAYESLASALRAPQWHARKNAAWALGALDDGRAVDPLIAALRDTEPPVRRSAAWALGAVDDRKAVPALVGALRDADSSVRAQAAWALGAIDSTEAVPGLTAALGDADPTVRAQAAWALGAIDDPRPVPELSRLVQQDADAKVRSQAAWALGAIGDGRASTALAAALKDADPRVRRQAAWALGAIQH